MLNTDKAWQKWGRDDPYFGVLADPRFVTAGIAARRDDFFATGETYVGHLLRRYEARFGPLARGRALDHGCGVGRLTLPFAARFDAVVAVDVSPAMLDEAAANASRGGHGNVDFAAADDALGAARGRFDFVNSHLVLQHVPVRRGMPIIEALVERVAPGGGFHISVSSRTDRGPARWLYWASANVPGVKLWQNVCAGRAWNAPAMQMNDYPIAAIMARLEAQGLECEMIDRDPHARFVTTSLIGRRPA